MERGIAQIKSEKGVNLSRECDFSFFLTRSRGVRERCGIRRGHQVCPSSATTGSICGLGLLRDRSFHVVEASVDRRGCGLLVHRDRAQLEVAELRCVAHLAVQPVCHGLGALRAPFPPMATSAFKPKGHATTIACF